jgi:hypothetical protein
MAQMSASEDKVMNLQVLQTGEKILENIKENSCELGLIL